MKKFIEKNPMIMIVIGVLGIGMSAIFVKFSAAPSPVTAAWRLLWTVVLMSPVVLSSSSTRQAFTKVSKKDWLLSILSGLALALHFILWFESLKHTSVSSSTTLVCTEVVWVSLGWCIFMGGKLRPKAIAAIGAALLGSVLVALADTSAGQAHLYGDLLSLASALAVAVYMLLGRAVQTRLSTGVYTYIVYFACLTGLLAVCGGYGFDLFAHGWVTPAVGLALAVFSTILGHSVFSWCLRHFSPAFVSASKLCDPVVAALLALPLFGEYPGWLQVVGGAVILGGVWYYAHLENKEAA
jgi:drug/metabolite transporter (DMT)-like permease